MKLALTKHAIAIAITLGVANTAAANDLSKLLAAAGKAQRELAIQQTLDQPPSVSPQTETGLALAAAMSEQALVDEIDNAPQPDSGESPQDLPGTDAPDLVPDPVLDALGDLPDLGTMTVACAPTYDSITGTENIGGTDTLGVKGTDSAPADIDASSYSLSGCAPTPPAAPVVATTGPSVPNPSGPITIPDFFIPSGPGPITVPDPVVPSTPEVAVSTPAVATDPGGDTGLSDQMVAGIDKAFQDLANAIAETGSSSGGSVPPPPQAPDPVTVEEVKAGGAPPPVNTGCGLECAFTGAPLVQTASQNVVVPVSAPAPKKPKAKKPKALKGNGSAFGAALAALFGWG